LPMPEPISPSALGGCSPDLAHGPPLSPGQQSVQPKEQAEENHKKNNDDHEWRKRIHREHPEPAKAFRRGLILQEGGAKGPAASYEPCRRCSEYYRSAHKADSRRRTTHRPIAADFHVRVKVSYRRPKGGRITLVFPFPSFLAAFVQASNANLVGG